MLNISVLSEYLVPLSIVKHYVLLSKAYIVVVGRKKIRGKEIHRLIKKVGLESCLNFRLYTITGLIT
jgi:hypothetical protein